DYPARQCLEFRKLSRVPQRPREWNSDGEDLIYVSNWSQRPEAVAQQLITELSRHAPAELIEKCCAQMMALYARQESLWTPGDVRRLVDRTREQSGLALLPDDLLLHVVMQLFDRLNVCLYRQQGLS